MVDDGADLLAQQVGGQALVERCEGGVERAARLVEGGVVAGVRDHGVAVVEGLGVDRRAQGRAQDVDAPPLAAEMPIVPAGSVSPGRRSILLMTVSSRWSSRSEKSGAGRGAVSLGAAVP